MKQRQENNLSCRTKKCIFSINHFFHGKVYKHSLDYNHEENVCIHTFQMYRLKWFDQNTFENELIYYFICNCPLVSIYIAIKFRNFEVLEPFPVCIINYNENGCGSLLYL